MLHVDLNSKAESLPFEILLRINCVLNLGCFFERRDPAAEVVLVIGLGIVLFGFFEGFGGLFFLERFWFDGKRGLFLGLFLFGVSESNQFFELFLVVLVFVGVRIAAHRLLLKLLIIDLVFDFLLETT